MVEPTFFADVHKNAKFYIQFNRNRWKIPSLCSVVQSGEVSTVSKIIENEILINSIILVMNGISNEFFN